MNIKRKLQANTIFSTITMLVIALVLYGSNHQLQEANKKQTMAAELLKNIYERVSLRDEYLLYREERAKIQWQRKNEERINILSQADEIFQSPADKSMLMEIRENQKISEQIFSEIVKNHQLVTSGERSATLARHIEDRLVSQILLQSYNLLTNAFRLQETSFLSLAAAQKRAIWIVFVFMLVMVGITTGNSLSINRIVAKKIGKLQEGTRIIGEGNLDYRIAHEGNDELTELTQSFNDATEKLKRHRVQLEAANQELDSFAYAVAHDLRAPLRAMSGFSQALLEDYGGEFGSEARVYIDQIIMASKRMGDLVEGLLILSRSTRGELKYSAIDLSAKASQILSDLAMADTARKVEWRVQPGLTALGDIRMIEVVLRNLLENAWKFTSHRVDPLIRLFAEPKGEEHFFCIADNGVGFDMRHAEHLFKPFQRLHRQDEFPGTGIGLATVQRILHRHNGTIHAIAAPGKGATFYFSLPVQG